MNKITSKTYAGNIDLVRFDEVDSTNDELRRLLKEDALIKTQEGHDSVKIVIASKQTQGRGRFERSWQSPPGGLYCSLALDISKATHETATLSLVLALGIHNALRALMARACQPKSEHLNHKNDTAHQPDIWLKWPNDLMCSRGKLVGILVETMQQDALRRSALCGIGINVKRPQKEASTSAAYLSDLCEDLSDVRELEDEIISSILDYYTSWQEAHYTFAAFTEEYNESLVMRGKRVVATNCSTQEAVEGVVQGVDEQGYLLLRNADGRLTRLTGGEVTLRT